MTTTKANYSGAAGAVSVLLLYFLSLIPGWDTIPTEPMGAIVFLVSYGVPWLATYFAPSNQPIATPPRGLESTKGLG